jgi:hypothetical protein
MRHESLGLLCDGGAAVSASDMYDYSSCSLCLEKHHPVTFMTLQAHLRPGCG